MGSLPPDLEKIFDEIDASDRAADAIVDGLSDEQLHWQPENGRSWSIAQCLEHLAAMNVVYGGAVRTGIDRARARGSTRRDPGRLGFFGGRWARSMEPPVKRRMPAPAPSRPGSGLPREEVLRRYHEAHVMVRGLIRDAASIDINRATFKNPFVPLIRVRVVTGLHVIAAHDRRHLWQAEQVKKRRNFPGAATTR